MPADAPAPGAIAMLSAGRFLAPPSACSYLPDETARMEYEAVAALTAEEYQARMLRGWRRFGHTLFRPRCRACTACRPLRVDVGRFRPDRSQRRAWAANAGAVRVAIGPPRLQADRLDLYRRYHAFQAEARDWPDRDGDPLDYAESFVLNPFPTEEWSYHRGDRLVGVGFVDPLPAGPSAIYFFYDPAERARSPGTFNVLTLIDRARAAGQPHVYLGYHVGDCRSLAYKARFVPNEVLGPDGVWHAFRGGNDPAGG